METVGLELPDDDLQDGHAPDGNQGLRDDLGKGRQAHSVAARQDNGAQIDFLSTWDDRSLR